jgi:putative FmdB family regulatory protein
MLTRATRIPRISRRVACPGSDLPLVVIPDARADLGGIRQAMPLYEYHCEPCDHIFETLIRKADDIARCPQCGGADVAKQLSVPSAMHSGRSRAGDLPICGDSSTSQSFSCGRPQCGSGICAGMN